MKRYVKSERTILHPRKSNAEYADKLLARMRKEMTDEDLLDFIAAYIPSDMMIEALEDIADRMQIDISDVE
jgi:pantothenate kinase-related protein Tda10